MNASTRRALTIILLALICLTAPAGHSLPPPPPQEDMVFEQKWQEVKRLVSEQKLEEASQAAAKIREQARKAGNQEQVTKAIIKEVQLRMGLHGYETAVRFLKEQDWPADPLERATLNLFYAHSLVNYYQGYSWEINQRERVEAKGEVDLKAWTKDQIYGEAQRAYLEVWALRQSLGDKAVSVLAEYIQPNDYPREIRSTLRDTVTYLFAALLGNSTLWKPEESNDLYRLDLKALATGPGRPEAIADRSAHPLERLVAVLADLEGWHASQGRPEAALEARLQRIRHLKASFSQARDREILAGALEGLLPEYRKVAWWAMGQALLAELVRGSDLVRAREIALEGYEAYPESLGGLTCKAIVAAIEAPDFQIASMQSDGAKERSIQVTHKNLKKLYFRAYALDLVDIIGKAKDYYVLPNYREHKELLDGKTPVASWTVNLPATPDYGNHRTYVTPPLKKAGLHAIMASAQPNFVEKPGNKVLAVNLIISNIVMALQNHSPQEIEVRVLDGQNGKPVAGAKVDLYSHNWQRGHKREETLATDKKGVATFSRRDDLNQSYFFLARLGQQLAMSLDHTRFYTPAESGEVTAALIFTDRSIYRPQQRILWKALVYRGKDDSYSTMADQKVILSLMDPNNEKVEEMTVRTNEHGTASGEFVIPTGRLLGQWRLQAYPSGQAVVRVEEYKRPTFDVSFKDADEALRLNRPATLKGEARYNFGLPVVTGHVRWRVTREPVYPWWWGMWWGRPSSQGGAAIVASGTSELGEDGIFAVTFTPEADETQADKKDITYRYRVTADVTDEGGETRSATRAFRLGFVSVEARFDTPRAFFLEGKAGEVEVVRTDLNGTPRPGKGSWRLVTLIQPDHAVAPASIPLPEPEKDAYHTPGDLLRPRWTTDYNPKAVMRRWPAGPERGQGALDHDPKGIAKVALPALPAGAYRLIYQTTDDFGTTYEASHEIIVAGKHTPMALPALLMAESTSGKVGEKVRLLAHSGLPEQTCFLEIYRAGRLVERIKMVSGQNPSLFDITLEAKDRGGFGVRLLVLRDYQAMALQEMIYVPWDNKTLTVELATFRDRMRPGDKETWKVTVRTPSGKGAEAGAAELLAYMYDKSLDQFVSHNPPSPLSLYPNRTATAGLRTTLGQSQVAWLYNNLVTLPGTPHLREDQLLFYDSYGIGGMGHRRMMYPQGALQKAEEMEGAPPPPPGMAMAPQAMPSPSVAQRGLRAEEQAKEAPAEAPAVTAEPPAPVEAPVEMRSDFAETAFWKPHLLTGKDGSASIEFTVPDSVTSWNIWVHGVTKDLLAGSTHREARSVKDLMVRPYMPRFLREGDLAELKVVVNNSSDGEIKGRLTLEITDVDTGQGVSEAFGVKVTDAQRDFVVPAGGGTNVTFSIRAPASVGQVAFRVSARSGSLSDGELRPLPVLPGRMHLSQSRFVTLKDKDKREMTFDDLKRNDDPSLINEQLVVTLDAQLFYGVLSALPYLINYPYECTEQILNRFVSTGILTGMYDEFPAVAAMAKRFSERDTPLETFDDVDPNRKMLLEETPWLVEARGVQDAGHGMVKVLDPRIARAEREASLAKLRKAQTSLGAFPWWPGGPPSPYMTLYLLYGFSKALEFGVAIPKDMVTRAWSYMHRHYVDEIVKELMEKDIGWELVTFLNYALSSYPDASWTGGVFSDMERQTMADFSFRHWKKHAPLLKGQLALTLKRMKRDKDATLVFASVMDSSKTTPDEGTFWAPEDRAWLWYNDTIETQAYALRAIMEVMPQDSRRHGLVQWLFLNKKLNHWKSTRSTAEVVYSLAHYLKAEGALGVREEVTVKAGERTVRYVFEPDQYTGKRNQLVIPGDEVRDAIPIVVEKEGKGMAFASATWHFSTERLPEEGRGDLFAIARTYFKREAVGREHVLRPLREGEILKVGDEVEVQISIRSKHAAEYVHLRDPRASGLEPENAVSRYRYDLGLVWYEEVRDSGTNFFFEALPVGEYTFKYRLRANMGGTFRVSPATLQSMYAPEFSAYSAGAVMGIE